VTIQRLTHRDSRTRDHVILILSLPVMMSDGASVYAKKEIFQVNEMNGILAVVAGSSSRSGEFHPQPLTEPYLIVSHHTALHNNLMVTNHIPNGQTMRERILLPSLTKQSISSYSGFCTCSSPIWLTSHSICQTEGSKPIY